MGEAINLVENFRVEKAIFNCGEFNDLEKELIKELGGTMPEDLPTPNKSLKELEKASKKLKE
ncbi:MAG: hypothetical protein IKF82_03000 [Bacilli bacterium]|nr:hypothetical protein [Bacilli bacterium]